MTTVTKEMGKTEQAVDLESILSRDIGRITNNRTNNTATRSQDRMTVTKEMGKKEQAVELETILSRDIGRVSPFQARLVLLCALACALSSFSTNEYVFTTGRINTRCLIPECEGSDPVEFQPAWLSNAVPSVNGGGFESCLRFPNVSAGFTEDATCPATLFDQGTTVACQHQVYEHDDTAVYDLDLGCSEWLRSLIGSARTAGALLSLPLAGAVSDRWGRRVALTLVCFNTAFIGVTRYFVNTYAGFIISVFLEAFLGAGAILAVGYILGVEMVPTKYRLTIGACFNTSSSIGQIILGLLAWAMPNWRYLTLVLYAPQLLTLAFFWIFPESIRWSFSKGRYAEVESILTKMAQSCGKELSEKTVLELRQAKVHEKQLSEENNEKEPWLVALVFIHKPILLRCLVAPVWWVSVVMIYYGLGVNAVNISGNRYINYIAVAAVDIPGFWGGNMAIGYFGRKPVLMICLWVCSLSQVAFIFLSQDIYALSLTVYLIGKLCIAATGSIMYVYTSELFPTQYRNRLFGYCSMTGRIGSIIAPLTPALGATVWEGLPFAIFAALAFISGLLMTLTPETRGCPLPDTMEEAAHMGQRHTKAQGDNISRL